MLSYTMIYHVALTGVPVFRLSTDFRIRGFSRPLGSVFIKSSKITVGGLEEKKTRGKKIFFGS